MKTQDITPTVEVETSVDTPVVNSLEALEALAKKASKKKGAKKPAEDPAEEAMQVEIPTGETEVVAVATKPAKVKELKVKEEKPAKVFNASQPTKFDMISARPAANAKELQQVLFPVEMLPVHEVIPSVQIAGVDISLTDDSKLVNFRPDARNVIVRTDEGHRAIIAFVGSTYNLVTNEMLLAEIKPIIDQVVGEKGYKVKAFNWKDRRFEIEFIIEANPVELAKGDLVYTTLKLYNSYDGGQKYNLTLGGKRKVCGNGLIAFETALSQVSRHTVNIKTAVHELEKALEANTKLADRYKTLTERAVTPEELSELTKFFKENNDKNFLFPKQKVDHSLEIAQKEAKQLYGGEMNAWLLYNGFNNTINHNISWEGRYLQKTDSQVLNKIVDTLGISFN